jgi:hypothetical protein
MDMKLFLSARISELFYLKAKMSKKGKRESGE